MGLEYFPCYHSYGKKCEKLTDQELGRLFRALFRYSETGERQELAGRESIAFDFIADDIDRAKEAYEAKCEKNRANASERKRTLANGSQTSQSKDKDKDKSKTEGKNEGIPPISPPGGKPLRFVPPTLAEVSAYCTERNSPVDAEQFWNYFQAGNWHDSKGQPVRNWKQKLLTWEKYQPKTPQPSGREALEELWEEYKADGSAGMGELPEWIDRP